MSFLSVASPAHGATGALLVRFAPEKDYGPFVYQDAAGAIRGLSVDMLALVGRAGGLHIDTMPARNLAQILALAQHGEVDLISSLRPTPERAAYLAFSRPYVSVPAVLVRRGGATERSELSDMAGRPVAVGKGYAVEAYVRDRFPAVSWVAMPDDTAALRALIAGEVEGVVADIASVAFSSRTHGLKGLQVHGPVGFDYPLSFAYPRERADIGVALERGLRALRTDERDTILQRWIAADDIAFRDTRADLVRKIAGLSGAMAVVIGGVAVVRRTGKGRHA